MAVSRSRMRKILSSNTFVLVIIIVLITLGLSLGTKYFASADNLPVILQTMTINGVLAIGLTFCILIGGIDLSVGSVLSLCGIMLAVSLQAGINPLLSIAISLCTGLVCGTLTGIMVSVFRLPAFIATLGMQSVAAGIALTITDGRPITGVITDLRFIGTMRVGPLPLQFLIMLFCFAVGYFILQYTRLGRYMYTIGGNSEAARFAGINLKFYTAIPFALSGLLASVAAIIMAARLNSAEAIAGQGTELDAIAAAIIGGTSMRGGEGKMTGTFLGALLMAVIKNGMVQMGLGTYPQKISIGVIIIAVVMIDMANRSRR